MIQLFSIPRGVINLDAHNNILHGKIVRDFEQRFAEYVDARHACSFNSASSAIFLALNMVKQSWPRLLEDQKLAIPGTIPPVVPNMVLNAGIRFQFVDNVEWIGYFYILANFKTFRIFDAAQVVHQGIFSSEASPQDLMIFSFYPTKPIGSIDGGMIVSDDADKIEYLRKLSMNGTSLAINSWERSQEMYGWKMYMNSIQAQLASEQLELQYEKRVDLNLVRDKYDKAFDAHSVPRSTTKGQEEGYHLYRVYVQDNQHFIQRAKQAGIICGIHYRSLPHHPLYGKYAGRLLFEKSCFEHLHTVSIPFHPDLLNEDIIKVIDFVVNYQDHYGQPDRDDYG